MSVSELYCAAASTSIAAVGFNFQNAVPAFIVDVGQWVMATVAFTGVSIDLDAWGYDRKCRNPEACEISADMASILLLSKDKSVTMLVASLLVHIVNSSAHHSDRPGAV